MNPSDALPVHPAALTDDQLMAECSLAFTRRSGPGGQHRNKTETAVTLTHRSSNVSAEASEARSQADNRREALRRLRLKLAVEVRTQLTGDTSSIATAPSSTSREPSALWLSRRHGQRITVASEHADFPALLAEALDALADAAYHPSEASRRLGISSSQLIALLRKHPPALEQLNRHRASIGKPPLN